MKFVTWKYLCVTEYYENINQFLWNLLFNESKCFYLFISGTFLSINYLSFRILRFVLLVGFLQLSTAYFLDNIQIWKLLQRNAT